MIKNAYLLLFLWVSPEIYAQNPNLTLDKGVKPHAGIDAIYRRFSEAYQTLNPDKVADLYTQTAAYLAPTQPILQGRSDIKQTFVRFFNYEKERNGTLNIHFRIVQRQVSGNLGYDVGIYTLTQKLGAEISKSEGKFIVVALRQKGVWRFQVDGYSDLPK